MLMLFYLRKITARESSLVRCHKK